MSHILAKNADMLAAICTALHNTTLNGGTVTCVAQPGNSRAKLTINLDGNQAYAKTWELALH